MPLSLGLSLKALMQAPSEARIKKQFLTWLDSSDGERKLLSQRDQRDSGMLVP